MPKQTFYNLQAEKRNKIIESAIEEFSQNLYVNASITKIAEKSGVAKGSMYQYFNDKKDLYKFILDMIGQQKLEYMKEAIEQKDQIDFISFMRLLFKSGLEFAIDNPLLASIANNFIKEQYSEISEEILKESQAKSNMFFAQIINSAKERGDIRSEVDPEIGAYIIYHFNNVLLDWIDLSRISQGEGVSIEDCLDKVDRLLEIIKHGFME